MSSTLTTRSQPAELSALVELEARWENLRTDRAVNAGKEDVIPRLHQRQRAYEAFHSKLIAYNKAFRPAHVPELLLNTPHRLGEWYRKMLELHAGLGESATGPYPAHLMEKAYRAAERMAGRLNKELVPRPAACADVAGAVRELEMLARWCDSLAPAE